jgi:hypothetical protein
MDCNRENMRSYLQVGWGSQVDAACWAFDIDDVVYRELGDFHNDEVAIQSRMRPDGERNDLEGDFRQTGGFCDSCQLGSHDRRAPMRRRRAPSSTMQRKSRPSSRASRVRRLILASMRCSIAAGPRGGSPDSTITRA